MTNDQGEGFLKRWSRLKRESDDNIAQRINTPAPAEDGIQQSASTTAHLDQSKINDAKTVPDGDKEDQSNETKDFSDFDFKSLDADSDYTRFMKDDVPSDVRTKALQQLWLTDPQFAHIDGLLEYAEDYTDAAVVPVGAVATAYRVGKGFLSDKDVEEWDELGKPPEEDEDREETVAAKGDLERHDVQEKDKDHEADAEIARSELIIDMADDDELEPGSNGDGASQVLSQKNRDDDQQEKT